jgi:hypothetical protein
MARQVSEESLDCIERFFVGVDDHVGDARHVRMHAPAAELLGIDRIVHSERSEERTGHRDDSAFAHHVEISEAAVPG